MKYSSIGLNEYHQVHMHIIECGDDYLDSVINIYVIVKNVI